MKHLLNGVAIAAALAIATPALAQAPAQAPMTPAKAAPAAKAPAAPKQAHHRPMRHHMAKRGKMHKASGDQMTEQLNREELARIQGGQMAAPAPATSETPFKKGQ